MITINWNKPISASGISAEYSAAGYEIDIYPGRAIAIYSDDETGTMVIYNNHNPDKYILSSAVQTHLDATALQREDDSADRCASFVNSTNAVWAAEATAFVAWRDTCWAAYIAAVASEPYPTPAELVASLPSITWPQ